MDGAEAAERVERVWRALAGVDDPELGMNIVDLGLVYEVQVDLDRVEVRMTLTSPSCPLGPHLLGEVRSAIEREVPEITELNVELVWEPAWNPARMSAQGRNAFGPHRR